MIKIYGMPTCPYCDYVHEQIKGRENEFEYINIGENIRNMSAFTRLRDTSPVFDHCKEMGDVGIPAFVFEDGRVSIDPADAGLIEYGTPASYVNKLIRRDEGVVNNTYVKMLEALGYDIELHYVKCEE